MKAKIHPRYYPNCKVYRNGVVVMTTGATVPELHVEVRDNRTVRMTLVRYRGLVEYMLGQFEGIVMMYERTPTIVIHQASRDILIFDVDHG